MKHAIRFLFLPLLILMFSDTSSAQAVTDRPPAVAGAFYPDDPGALRTAVKDLFAKAVPSKHFSNVLAVITPHAGYVYSGLVAASAFNQIDPEKQYENIFVLGPSHRVGFDGAAVYTRGNFQTPLGIVKVNTALAKTLLKRSSLFVDRPDAHQQEHSIEVELPFLQTRLKKAITIVPIVFGADAPETCAQLAEVLRPYLTPSNLFVVSTDFSHYPSYADARMIDKATGDAVLTNSAGRLLATLRKNEEKHIPELATSMCGFPCVLTLLFMTEGNSAVTYHEIQYKNSGDIAGGDRSRVVGYHAIAVTQEPPRESSFNLQDTEKRNLLTIARTTIEQYVKTGELHGVDNERLSPSLKTPCGAFVTLKKHGELRGCIGRFDATEPLYKVVQAMGIAAATQDPRFSPVTSAEVPQLEVEISVLTPMKQIRSIDEIQLGKHGIYIRKGRNAGTFLPQVASETGWSKEEFLGHCARDKAGLTWDGWKDADIYTYEALVFSEADMKSK